MRETKEITYKRLSAVRSKNSKIELALRRKLFSLGYRYKIHYDKAFGKPDIAFVKKKIAIFCDSNFWHGYRFNQIKKRKLKTNRKYWENKIKKNKIRDGIVTKKLKQEGWKVLRFWEHQIINNIEFCIDKIQVHLKKV